EVRGGRLNVVDTERKMIEAQFSQIRRVRTRIGPRGRVERKQLDLEMRIHSFEYEGDVLRFHARHAHVPGGNATVDRRDVILPEIYCFAPPAAAAAMYFERNSATRARHIPTNPADVSLSTDFHACLTAGRVFRQIARLHHFSPFSLPSLVAHMDFQAMRSGWLMCSAAPSQPCWWIR